MVEEGDYIAGTYKLLEDSFNEPQKYEVEIMGRKFIVFPGVFSPRYFKDTEFFVKNLPIQKNEEFLEIGSGIGVISIFAIVKGASKVVSIDINPNAVENTKENVEKHRFAEKIRVLQGDLFSPLKNSEKFDTIFWNMPFGFVKKKNLSFVEKSVFDTNYEDIEAFIKNAKKYLKENGKLLIGFSSTFGKFDLLKRFLDENNFKLKCLTKHTGLEYNPSGLVKVELFEAKSK